MILTYVLASLLIIGGQPRQTPSTDFKAVNLRERVGERFRFTCPKNIELKPVWGTNVYTDDSSVCTAAVHAGAITASDGGVVTIEIRLGQPIYRGSLRNGVESLAFGKWNGSYVFVSNKVEVSSEEPEAASAPSVVRIRANWDSRMTQMRGHTGQLVVVNCPSGERSTGPLWGTGLYSDDSAVCLAGLHSGAITKDGGDMLIEIQGASAGFSGSKQNGISSYSFGEWPGSFRVVTDSAGKRPGDCSFGLRLQK